MVREALRYRLPRGETFSRDHYCALILFAIYNGGETKKLRDEDRQVKFSIRRKILNKIETTINREISIDNSAFNTCLEIDLVDKGWIEEWSFDQLCTNVATRIERAFRGQDIFVLTEEGEKFARAFMMEDMTVREMIEEILENSIS